MEYFNAAYTRYWNYVCAIIRKRLNDISPEDIAQKVFLALMVQGEKPVDVKNWLATVAVRHCIDYSRGQNVVNRYKDYIQCTQDGTTIQDDEDKEIQKEQQELILRIREEMDNLPERARRAFALHYLHGYKCREVAKIMNTHESTVCMQIKIARDKLRNALKEFRCAN